MKIKTSYLIILLFAVSSCSTSYYSNNNYLDPNYLNSDEFIVVNSDIKNLNQNTHETEVTEFDSTQIEETNIINNYYEDNSTFDLYYSSRIRRFHRPYYSRRVAAYHLYKKSSDRYTDTRGRPSIECTRSNPVEKRRTTPSNFRP